MWKCFSVFSIIAISTACFGQTQPTPKTIPAAVDYHQTGAPLPALRVITLDTISKPTVIAQPRKHRKRRHHDEATDTAVVHTRVVTEKDVAGKGNLFVMTFNPTCGHCEDQTEQFIKNISLFKNANLVMVTNPVMKGYLPDFIRNHHIRNYPVIQVGVDSSGYIGNTFLYGSLPQINIYDNKLKLLKTYQGEIVIDSIKQYIN